MGQQNANIVHEYFQHNLLPDDVVEAIYIIIVDREVLSLVSLRISEFVKRRLSEGCVAVDKLLSREQNEMKRLQWTKEHENWTSENWEKEQVTHPELQQEIRTSMKIPVATSSRNKSDMILFPANDLSGAKGKVRAGQFIAALNREKKQDENNSDDDKVIEFLFPTKRDVKTETENLYSTDNAPDNTAATVKSWFEEHENYIKNYMKDISLNIIQDLYESIPRRIRAWLKTNDDFIRLQPTSKRDSNSRRIRETERRGKRENKKIQATNSNRNYTLKKRLDNLAKRIYQWCAQCCGKKKAKLTKVHKSTSDFFKHLKEKCEDHKKKAKEKKKKKKEKEKEDVPESFLPAFLPYQKEELVKDRAPDVGIDFTKTCCYLCAQNAMAIAAAISKVGKFHVSIQASTKEILTFDKSCTPNMQVRTVQSSVKVRTRDTGTVPYKEKGKRLRPKLKLKKFNIIPKLKFPVYPKVRTVACETDKSMRHNNIPQCRARRGADCVTNVNRT
ncbi:hypothetical protein WN51_00597 [Melipona quadrifasciata]|uniref:Uncharacterized protein n=1 Tax=Melipona quadrifasciata TaxID=166423 RepID=A0A0N1ITM3_9HYME|nr:hypothetical protein WN51_00597 [Melipona quadrifasciata]